LSPRHEAVDFDRLSALDLYAVEIAIVDRDVRVLGYLIAAPFVGGLDDVACPFVDKLLSQAIAGLLVDLAESNALRRGRCRINGDRTRYERELQEAFPIGARGGH
jgi:hypothetical protein